MPIQLLKSLLTLIVSVNILQLFFFIYLQGLNQKAWNVQIVDDQDGDAGRAPLYYLELLTVIDLFVWLP